MKYAQVQQSLEEYFGSNWTETSIQNENAPFDSELYDEYVRLTLQFGDGLSRTVGIGCYRVIGLFIVSIFVRPSVGTARALALADTVSGLLVHKVVRPVAPLEAPAVNLKVPDLTKNFRERDGWVMAQVSCPFYYDLEI